MADVTPSKTLIGLHPSAYEHPSDASALNTLSGIAGLHPLLKKLHSWGFERLLRLELTGSYIRVTKDNFVDLHGLLMTACTTLDMPHVPDLYMAGGGLNAFTTGVDRPLIVINSDLIDVMTEEELMFVIAHELGHIKSAHVLYYQVAEFVPVLGHLVGEATLGLGSLVSKGLELALLKWQRMAELTADRAGLLGCQDIGVALKALMKLAGVPRKYRAQVNTDEFIVQAREFEAVDTEKLTVMAKWLSSIDADRPWTVMRAKELLKWIDTGEYDHALSAPMSGRIKDPKGLSGYCLSCGNALRGGEVFCPRCGSSILMGPEQISRKFFLQAGFQKVVSGRDLGVMTLLRDGRLEANAILFHSDQPLKMGSGSPPKTYIVYREKPPTPDQLQILKLEGQAQIIPLPTALLERALTEGTCAEMLRELEEPYVTRTDPYDESQPISDPTWFFGREDLLERLPPALWQGQHVGLFGLRKVGKTSLINQLRQRLSSQPTVWIDCQGLPGSANALLIEMGLQLDRELRALKIFAGSNDTRQGTDHRAKIIHLHELWQGAGGQGPFIIILDEVDKLFPDRRVKGSDEILAEWVKLSRILRALAQEKKCLAMLVTAYRPDVNRQNMLSPEIGENPMFMSFQEYFLGSLTKLETERMIREIGAWKNINWSQEALSEAHELCGGHPLVTRFFASDACEQGDLKNVDLARVKSTADATLKGFHRYRIGRYFEESVWKLLQPDECATLLAIARGSSIDYTEDALTHLEQFGLVRLDGGTPEVSAKLLEWWLKRSKTTWPSQ